VIESGLQRGRLSIVTDQRERPQPGSLARELRQHRLRAVAGAVIDQDQLERTPGRRHRRFDPRNQFLQVLVLVEHRNDDRHRRPSRWRIRGGLFGAGAGGDRTAAIQADDGHDLIAPRSCPAALPKVPGLVNL